jgi:hypothetical protein
VAIRILDQSLEESGIGLRRILVSSCRWEGRSESTRFGVFAEEGDDVVVVYQRCVHDFFDLWHWSSPVRTCLIGINMLIVVPLSEVWHSCLTCERALEDE